jgi:hypothetical protein
MPIVLFVLFAVVMIIISVLSSNYARKQAEIRRAAMYALSQRLGLNFQPEILRVTTGFWDSIGNSNPAVEQFLVPFQHLTSFGQGHSHSVKNLITGAHKDFGVTIFDYQYKVTTNNGKSSSTTTYNVQVVSVALPMVLPRFTMQPENFLLAIGEKFGYREIEFESEEFNKRWFVRGEDERSIYDLLHPRAMERMQVASLSRWEFGGNMITVLDTSLQEPMSVERTFHDIADFVALVPNYYRQDRKLS